MTFFELATNGFTIEHIATCDFVYRDYAIYFKKDYFEKFQNLVVSLRAFYGNNICFSYDHKNYLEERNGSYVCYIRLKEVDNFELKPMEW